MLEKVESRWRSNVKTSPAARWDGVRARYPRLLTAAFCALSAEMKEVHKFRHVPVCCFISLCSREDDATWNYFQIVFMVILIELKFQIDFNYYIYSYIFIIL